MDGDVSVIQTEYILKSQLSFLKYKPYIDQSILYSNFGTRQAHFLGSIT